MNTYSSFRSAILLSALAVFALAACRPQSDNRRNIVVQAHRGGAALYPENTVPAMLHAVSIGVPVLEMDLHVTRDSQVVVSHDAFLNHLKALTPEGDTIPAAREREYRIYSMTYDSLRRYDVGTLPREVYPGRFNLECHIPLVTELIDSVEQAVARQGLPPVGYNIEIKSAPSKDGIDSPDYRTFADLCMEALLSRNLGNRLLVQSFDVRTLNYLHSRYPSLCLSYLVGESGLDFGQQMALLDFTPEAYSPESHMLTAETVKLAHDRGMKVVPWTVDDCPEALRVKALGIDAIITNRPDSMMVWMK